MTLADLTTAVENYLGQFLWRFQQLPTDGSVLVVDDPGVNFSVRAGSPISNVVVAYPGGPSVAALQAEHDQVVDSTTGQFHRRVGGSWEVLDVDSSYDPNFTPNALIYSPYDGRFWFVDSDYQLTEVNLTTATPGG